VERHERVIIDHVVRPLDFGPLGPPPLGFGPLCPPVLLLTFSGKVKQGQSVSLALNRVVLDCAMNVVVAARWASTFARTFD
jgi:hypothetical protein